MPNNELRTRHTVQAHELADAVNAGFANVYLAPGQYFPELTSPEGQSTGGGVASLQHIRLVPRLDGYPTIVIGTANHVTGRAELRSFAHVESVYAQRFGEPVPLDGPQYREFLATAKNLLEVVQLKVHVVEARDPSREASTIPPAAFRETARRTSIWVLVGVAIASLAILALVTVAFRYVAR